MMRWLYILGLVAQLLIGSVFRVQPVPPAPAPPAGSVPVLLYHHITTANTSDNGAVVTAGEFEYHMAWLKANGYSAITTAELGAWLKGRGALPARPVLITFDDGYSSNYELAYPILARYGMKATIFMISSWAGDTRGDLSYLTWAQMAEMERSGVVEFQAHTHDAHHREGTLPALQAWSPANVGADLAQLRQGFAAAGLKAPIAYAYPFGAYNKNVLTELATRGIQLGFTVEAGHVRAGDNPLTLKRQVIYPGTSACRFEELVSGAPSCRR